MSYLKEFLTQINNRDFHKFLVLWEEYCASDVIEAEEFIQLLRAIAASEMAKQFGQMVETAIPLWEMIQDEKGSKEAIKLLIDIQTTNSPVLGEITMRILEKYYGQDPKFDQRLRIIGLRDKSNFRGALSKYDLVSHMNKGNFVYHTGGWGTGEIIEASLVREHLDVDFENVSGRKDISFANAFKTLIPLSRDHFLVRRFSNPDLLEKEGKENPIALIKLLLNDLGPKTAADIKDELCELVIPEKEWTKWWQNTRAKIKKDPMIETPTSLKDSFYLRKAELSSEDRLRTLIEKQTAPDDIIQTTYNFVRDTPAALKNTETKEILQNKLVALLNMPLNAEQKLQVHLLLEQFFGYEFEENTFSRQIIESSHIEDIIQSIDIIAFKKRILVAIKEYRQDWSELFLSLLFKLPQLQLRDYIQKELNRGPTKKLFEAKITSLLRSPSLSPEIFLWYFQKLVVGEEEDIPYQDKQGREQFFESFLILLSQVESHASYKDLVKKMYTMLSGKRYALVRQLLQDTTLEYTKEILLLASKCHTLSDHDIKILRSLSEVVHPSLAPSKQRKGVGSENEEVIWTTEEGYLKIQDRIRHIGTIEMIDNAREIEAARALGDLRENSEFKFAQERRARLQSELKTLSEQFNRARIINKEDVQQDEVGIGSVVELVDEHNKKLSYSILGPWDANPEESILSFNSKFAQAMIGKKVGEFFRFKDDEFKIAKLSHLY